MTGRPRRADALRNYDMLVAAAREAMTEQGPGAPLDDIARRAGVGSATLYRHFPTRHALLVAVYSHEVESLAETGRRLLGSTTDGQVLNAWLRILIAHISTRRGLAAAALSTAAGASENLVSSWHGTLETTIAELLADAREHRTARQDVEPSELLALAIAIASVTETAPNTSERLVDLVLEGVAPR